MMGELKRVEGKKNRKIFVRVDSVNENTKKREKQCLESKE